MKDPVFLTLAEILILHNRQIFHLGGDIGIRDLHLLESALAQPEASFGGKWLHADLFDMAAAYSFHICQNHPFIDGNKRTALDAALTFLEMNGISLFDPQKKLLEAMYQITKKEINKKHFANLLRHLPQE
jgi:death-on-curing protein